MRKMPSQKPAERDSAQAPFPAKPYPKKPAKPKKPFKPEGPKYA